MEIVNQMCLGMLVTGCFADSRYMRYILHSYGIMVGLLQHGHLAYSRFSAVMLIYSCMEEVILSGGSDLFPFLFFNSSAVVTGFHTSMLLDMTSFRRLADKYQVSYRTFFWGNILLHFLPLVVAASFAFTKTPKEEIMWYSGFVTANINLSWTFLTVKGLNLDSIYVQMKTMHWYVIWATTIAAHTLSCVFFLCVK
jgi:hypothetical protein